MLVNSNRRGPPVLTNTLIGCGAILLWSALAVLTASSGLVPPFQLAAMTFAIGGLLGAASWIWRPRGFKALRQPWPVWVLGLAGLFGYHALYFAALRLAPPADAGLICYLWPLLIVVFAAFLPGERMTWPPLAGATLGFLGVLVLASSRLGSLAVGGDTMLGYAMALGCALVWSTYSVLSRRFGSVPTDAVAGFCLVTAILATACHLAFEDTVWPSGTWQWLAVVALGLGPVGAAFYLWDYGVKNGDIRMLGVASYAGPVLSTLILVAAGWAEPTLNLMIAATLIVGGALIATFGHRLRPGAFSPQKT